MGPIGGVSCKTGRPVNDIAVVKKWQYSKLDQGAFRSGSEQGAVAVEKAQSGFYF